MLLLNDQFDWIATATTLLISLSAARAVKKRIGNWFHSKWRRAYYVRRHYRHILAARALAKCRQILRRVRLFTRRIIIRAINCDFLVIVRMIQAAWRLSFDVYVHFHATQVWVHTFWVYLARLRKANYNWRASAVLLKRIFIWLPIKIINWARRIRYAMLGPMLLFTAAHALFTVHTLDLVALHNYIQLAMLQL